LRAYKSADYCTQWSTYEGTDCFSHTYCYSYTYRYSYPISNGSAATSHNEVHGLKN
jgi:hypothetical protein